MFARIVSAALLSLALGVPAAFADQRDEAKEQVEFGIQVAQRGLWREAIYRWERATQLDPTYAAALQQPRGRLRARRSVGQGPCGL